MREKHCSFFRKVLVTYLECICTDLSMTTSACAFYVFHIHSLFNSFPHILLCLYHLPSHPKLNFIHHFLSSYFITLGSFKVHVVLSTLSKAIKTGKLWRVFGNRVFWCLWKHNKRIFWIKFQYITSLNMVRINMTLRWYVNLDQYKGFCFLTPLLINHPPFGILLAGNFIKNNDQSLKLYGIRWSNNQIYGFRW